MRGQYNCSEQAESLDDEAAGTDLRCEQPLSAQPVLWGRFVSVKVMNRYEFAQNVAVNSNYKILLT